MADTAPPTPDFKDKIIDDNEKLRDKLGTEIDKAIERIEDLEDALTRIQQWSEAYPPDIFIPMDDGYAKKAHQCLLDHGMKIDRISADAMRHCLKGVGQIARGALET